jgi:hypothetical protein
MRIVAENDILTGKMSLDTEHDGNDPNNNTVENENNPSHPVMLLYVFELVTIIVWCNFGISTLVPSNSMLNLSKPDHVLIKF